MAKSAPVVEPEKTGNVIDGSRYKYDRVKFVGADGKTRTSANNGDSIAQAMLGMTPDEVMHVVEENGLAEKLAKHYRKLNPGHFRMVVGNALRATIKKGGKVKVNGRWISSLDQPVKVPKAKRVK